MNTRFTIHTSNLQPFIFLPTSINGKGPFSCVLDTGASMSVVTEDVARTLGIENTESKEAMGSPGKKIKVMLGRVEYMSVGEARIENIQVAIMRDMPRCVGQGVIGYNFLKHFAVSIDYPNKTLLLSLPTDKVPINQPDRNCLRLKLASSERPIILVDVLVNKRHACQFLLDTGASQTVVSSGCAKDMNITSHDDEIIGAGGTNLTSSGTLRSLSIGHASQNEVPVLMADIFQALSEITGTQIDGILGYDFLSNYRVVIDYPNGTLKFDG